jgi:hypothetical protein
MSSTSTSPPALALDEGGLAEVETRLPSVQAGAEKQTEVSTLAGQGQSTMESGSDRQSRSDGGGKAPRKRPTPVRQGSGKGDESYGLDSSNSDKDILPHMYAIRNPGFDRESVVHHTPLMLPGAIQTVSQRLANKSPFTDDCTDSFRFLYAISRMSRHTFRVGSLF